MEKAGIVLGIIVLFVLGIFAHLDLGYFADTVFFISFFGILALSLNLEYGYAGLDNFGKIGFTAVGAYTAGVLSAAFGVPFPIALIAAFLAGGVVGFLVALPTVRLRAEYLAMVTLVVSEMIRILLRNTPPNSIIGGVFGLRGMKPALPFIDNAILRNYVYVTISFGILLFVYLLMERWGNSPLGRVLKSIRDDELASRSIGKFTYRYKLLTMFVANGLAGLAGALYAYYLLYLNPDNFIPVLTFLVWTMVIVGGAANNAGTLLGTALVILLNRVTQILKDYITLPVEPNYLQMMIVGLLIVLFLMFKPQGVVPEKPVKTIAWSVLEEEEVRKEERG